MTDQEIEKLAEVFQEAFCKHQDLAPISEKDKAATIAGVHAVLEALNDVRARTGG